MVLKLKIALSELTLIFDSRRLKLRMRTHLQVKVGQGSDNLREVFMQKEKSLFTW